MATLTRAQIENAIVSWAAAATTGTVIVLWPEAPRPTLPYLTVKISNLRAIGHDEGLDITTLGSQEMTGDRVVTATIEGYGPGAMDLVEAVRCATWLETPRAALKTVGLSPLAPEQIVDLSEFLNEAEGRAQVDIQFALRASYNDAVGLIETVIGAGDVVSPQQTTVITFRATKPSP